MLLRLERKQLGQLIYEYILRICYVSGREGDFENYVSWPLSPIAKLKSIDMKITSSAVSRSKSTVQEAGAWVPVT